MVLGRTVSYNYSTEQRDSLGGKYGELLYEVAVGLVCGIIMGVCLEKSRALDQQVIKNQMLGKSMICLKLMCSGMASSAVSMCFISWLAPRSWQIVRWDASRRRRLAAILSGVIMGFGTALGGSTPATAAAQFGARFSGSGLSLLGGLSGALAFGVLEPWIRARLKPHAESRKEADLADEQLLPPIHFNNVSNSSTSNNPEKESSILYRRLAIFAIFIAFLFTICLEAAFPWPQQARTALVSLPRTHSARLGRQYGLKAHAWSPSFCGCIIGFAQLPLALNGAAIETSSAYLTLADSILRLDHRPGRNDLRANAGLLAHAAQLAVLIGIAIGSALSARISTLLFLPSSSPNVNSPILSFIGTFVVLVAARFARGCEFYHALAGLSSFSIPSFFVITFFFLSGSSFSFLFLTLSSHPPP